MATEGGVSGRVWGGEGRGEGGKGGGRGLPTYLPCEVGGVCVFCFARATLLTGHPLLLLPFCPSRYLLIGRL